MHLEISPFMPDGISYNTGLQHQQEETRGRVPCSVEWCYGNS